MVSKKDKNIILFVENIFGDVIASLRAYAKKEKRRFRLAVILDAKKKSPDQEKKIKQMGVDLVLTCDFSRPFKIAKALKPFYEELLVITSRIELAIPDLAKIVPQVPYLRTSSAESLEWSANKIMMRERFNFFDEKMTPKFIVIKNVSKSSVQKVKEEVGFPLIIKPAGLAASLLVNICYHEEELVKVLKRTFRQIKKVYKDNGRSDEPRVLVEQFMEGDMYSIDLYVNSRGKVYFCPMVAVKTGRQVGFDDFFGYQQMVPTMLKKDSIEKARLIAEKAVHALGLASTTVHIELMKGEDDWKVIELGARIGGFRQLLYKYSYGIDHGLNDILIRIPKQPIIPTKLKGYTVVFKFFAKKEGVLEQLKGIKKIEELKSVVYIKVNKKIGDRCHFAKHGGRSVCNVGLFNKDRSKLQADMRRVEQTLVIKTS